MFCAGIILCACSIIPKNAEEFKEKTIEWLQDNKPLVKRGIILIGSEAMSRATGDAERKEISNQMWAVSTAFYSMATGEIVTKTKFDSTIAAFGKGGKSPSYTKYMAEVSIIWTSIFPRLNFTQGSQLAIDYLLIFAEAAQEVAATYKEDINA